MFYVNVFNFSYKSKRYKKIEIVFRWVNLGELDYIFYINIDGYWDNIIINFFLIYKSNIYI